MFKTVFWLYSLVCFYWTAGTHSTMSQQFDATSQYNYKTVDTVHTGSRYDTIAFFAPTQTNQVAQITFSVLKNHADIDTCRVYINGELKAINKLTTDVAKLYTLTFTPSKPMNPNKILIKIRVKAGSASTSMKVYVRNYWIQQ